MKTSVFPRFFAYFAKSLCAWQCIGRLPKSISFYHEKGLISEPGATKIHPKSTPNPKKCKGRGTGKGKGEVTKAKARQNLLGQDRGGAAGATAGGHFLQNTLR